MTSRAGPGLDLIRGDEPGGIRKRQSVTRQSDRFKLGRPRRPRGAEWSRSTTPPVFVSPSRRRATRMQGISITTLQKVTGVFPPNVTVTKRHRAEVMPSKRFSLSVCEPGKYRVQFGSSRSVSRRASVRPTHAVTYVSRIHQSTCLKSILVPAHSNIAAPACPFVLTSHLNVP